MKRSFLLNALFFVTSLVAFAQPPTINLSAAVGTPATSVTVNWDAQPASYTITGVADPFMVNGVYINYRELTSPASSWVRTALLPRTQTSWVHTGVVAGKTYEYSFQTNVTVGSLMYDSPSPPESAAIAGSYNRYVTAAIPATPPAPANLNAVLGSAPRSVQLNWVDQTSPLVDSVRILYRVQGATTWMMSPNFLPSQTTWVHSGLEAFTVYEYSLQVGDVSATTVWTPNPAASSAGSNYAIILTPQDVSVAPTNLFIDMSKATPTSLYITWTDNATNEDGYEIAYSGDGLSYTTARVATPNTNSFTIAGLIPNDNVYVKVRAYNITPAGLEQFSSYSGVVVNKTLKSAPAAPTDVTEVQTCVNQTSFHWSHPDVSEVEAYWVEQSSDGANWSVIDKFPVSAYPAGSGFPYVVNNLPSGQQQYFRIRALTNLNSLNPAFSSTGTASAPIRVVTKVATGPPPPFNLRVISYTNTEIAYRWELPYGLDMVCNTNARTATHLRYRVNDGPVIYVILGPDATSYSLSGLPENAKVEFGVYGVNGFYGLDSETVYVTSTTFGPPAAPSNFVTSSNIDVFKTPNISMNWADNSDSEDKFVVEATIDTVAGISFTVTLAPNVNYYTHIPVDEGVTWYYRSYAMNAYGKSGYSNWSYGRVEYSQLPEKPYDLRGTMSAGKVLLNWKDDSMREEAFEVERSEDNGATFEKIGVAFRNMLTFTDSTMEFGNTYKYRVRAVNTLGGSGYSNMVTIEMPEVTTPVVSLENLINVYPNPVVNRVRVNVPEFISEEGGFVSVYDQSQKLVYKGKLAVGNKAHDFDMQNLKEGMYVIVIATDTQKISKKVYKK